MPKTLAALPSSQYATVLSLVSGNDLAFFARAIVSLNAAASAAAFAAALSEAAEVFHRRAARGLQLTRGSCDRMAGLGWKAMNERLEQALQVKNSLARRGAALRRSGKAWKMGEGEAIVGYVSSRTSGW